jgi:His/Glu/Gln/Arg/opine family amino acid ABC transporter permease subunit
MIKKFKDAKKGVRELGGIFKNLSAFSTEFARQFVVTFLNNDNYKLFLRGLKNTLILTICAVSIGFFIGVIVAFIKFAAKNDQRYKFLGWLCNAYTTIIRGTPIVVQLLIANYIIFSRVNSAFLIAIFCFGINSGAYVAETMRSGFDSVDHGQTEAGRSLGMPNRMVMMKIIFPQAIKNILPALGNEFISMLKETSVAGYISVMELTRMSDRVRAATFLPFFPLIFTAAVYLGLVMILSRLLRKLEKRFHRADHNINK